MKNLKELRQKLAAQSQRGKAALAEYQTLTAKTDLTAEDTTKATALDAEIDALETECADLKAQIEAKEKQQRRASAFAGAAMLGALTVPAMARNHNAVNPDANFGFQSMTEFAIAVRGAYGGGGAMDPRLLAATPSNTMVNQGSGGEGFMAPPDFTRAVWDMVFPGYGFDLMDLVTPSPTSANMIQLSKDETTPWSTSGVQASWRSENAQLSASKLNLNGSLVPLHELYAFVVATQELLNDAPQLNDRMTRKAAMAIRFAISKAMFGGDGNGKPMGFFGGPATITQAKEAGQTAGTIVLNNIAKMFTRLPAGSLTSAVWLANIEILPQLLALNVGTWPVWMPPNAGLQQAPGGTLLGRPLVFSEQATALGTVGDLTLLDPTGYFLATKEGGGIDFAQSIHLFFDYNASAFRWIFRVGGQPLLTAPINPANGTLTKGHFVNLQAR